MGVVYRAREVETGRTFALKVIREGRLASRADVRRFRIDYRIAARLKHESIVPVCEVDELDGQPFSRCHWYSMTCGLISGSSHT